MQYEFRSRTLASLALGGALLLQCAGASLGATEVEMIPATGDPEATWPRWRGPSGQGFVAGDGYVDRWSATENVRWRVDVPGSGNSSPIVWGDRLFLTTSYDGGKRRSVLAYSIADGTQLWETFVPDRAAPEKAYPKNGHASSTPSTDGERVYAYFGNQGLVAVDFDGRVDWHVSLGPFEAYHGTAASPLLYQDRVILVQDQNGGGFIAAFDKQSGRQLWKTARDAKVGWNSPVAIRATDSEGRRRDEIIFSGQQQVTAYDPATGRELWLATGNTFEVIPTPVVAHDMVFCSSGRAGPTLAIRPGGSGDVTESRVVWSSPKGSPFVVAPLVQGDYLYMVNDMASVLTVHEARSGEVVFQERLGKATREGFSGAPVATGGKVFFTNDEGETFVIRQGPEFEILHVNRLAERVIASPALAGGVWYFRTAGSLLAIAGEAR